MSKRAAVVAVGLVILVVGAVVHVHAQTAKAVPTQFEVAAVKPLGPLPATAPDQATGIRQGCDGGFPRLEGRRFIVTTTPYALITWAYGYNKTWGCSYVNFGDLLTGGPAWIRAERYEIQALIPEDAPLFSLDAFMKGEAPGLETMLRNLLADRFSLAVHTVKKEVSAYAITTGRGAPKLTRPAADERPGFRRLRQAGANGKLSEKISGRKTELRDLAFMLLLVTRRPVIDRTGLTGEFNFDLEFAPFDSDTLADSTGVSLFTAMQEQLGLRLETVKGPLDGLVIDRAERPSEN